jgi:hypothetical protein
VIVDIPRFVAAERPYWDELRALLDRMDTEPERRRLALAEISACTTSTSAARPAWRASTLSPPTRRCAALLETLVSRAYSEIHETRAPKKIRWKAILLGFPRAFRRHLGAFRLSLGITLLGCAFGWFAIRMDPHSKAVLMPFQGLLNSPAERVHQEETASKDRLSGEKASFSAQLMTHNIQVTVVTLAWG